MSKIAVLTDSTADIPAEVAKEKNIYVVPLKVIYKDAQYSDGVDITSEEMYRRLPEEIPTTSLPTGEDISHMFDKIKADGYDEVICTTLSSGLSGTHSFINIIASERQDLKIKMVDTKNIAMAAGFSALAAADFVADGKKTLEEAFEYVSAIAKRTKVFITLETLEYLRKGGRIGLVAATLGTKINLRPIISCNEEGVYYTAAKTFGRSHSLRKVLDMAEKFAKNAKICNIAVSHGLADADAKMLTETIKEKCRNIKDIYVTNVGPVLGIHTGPGAIGFAVQIIE